MTRPGIDHNQLVDRIIDVYVDKGSEGATISELSKATGLKKASLYYHFPGGKGEIIEIIARKTINRLESEVFSHLASGTSLHAYLSMMMDGFEKYCDGGRKKCVLVILNSGNHPNEIRSGIIRQFNIWIDRLSKAIASTGRSKKGSDRIASEIFANLYGSLTLSQLLDDPKIFRKTSKRLRKQFENLS